LREAFVLGWVLGTASAVYCGLAPAFTGGYSWLRGYVALMVSLFLGCFLLASYRRWIRCVGWRGSARIFVFAAWAVLTAGFEALGLGRMFTPWWNLFWMVPIGALLLELHSALDVTMPGPLVLRSRYVPVGVAAICLAVLLARARALPGATVVFLAWTLVLASVIPLSGRPAAPGSREGHR